MTNIYYTVEKQTYEIGSIEECTGWKKILVYEIQNNVPKLWFELEKKNDKDSAKCIRKWLDKNGFKDREYNMIWL